MSLKERVYSVLVISAAEGFNDALTALLPEARYSPVQFATNVGAARRALAERAFDIVIINSPLPDETGIRFAIDASNSKETVVLLMIRAELQEEVFDRVAEHGVFVLSKPTAKPIITTALSWLSSARVTVAPCAPCARRMGAFSSSLGAISIKYGLLSIHTSASALASAAFQKSGRGGGVLCPSTSRIA